VKELTLYSRNTFAGKRVLVIGALGPQESGKSTLLNFMFGCGLSASEGRVTKVSTYNHSTTKVK
jgi:energy-coupling factor transporter ATP-binding protein EcfA2